MRKRVQALLQFLVKEKKELESKRTEGPPLIVCGGCPLLHCLDVISAEAVNIPGVCVIVTPSLSVK